MNLSMKDKKWEGMDCCIFVIILKYSEPASCHSGTVVSVPAGGFICPDSIPGERKLPQYQGFWRASAYPLAASCGVAADCL